jgi:hypothetical protein
VFSFIESLTKFWSYLPEKNRKDECGYRDDVIEIDRISRRCISKANVVKTRNCEPVGDQESYVTLSIINAFDQLRSYEIYKRATHPISALVKIHMNAFKLISFNFPLHKHNQNQHYGIQQLAQRYSNVI